MAVTTRLMSPGNYSVNFSQEFTPTEIIEAIKEWGHIVLTPQQVDVTTLADSDILSSATYTGIVLNRTLEDGTVTVSGQGLELYMGDGAAKGMVIAESNNVGKVRVYTGTTLAETLFNSTAQTNKPLGLMLDEAGNSQAITQGTISNPTGTYTGQHFVETALSALKFVSETLDIEYRVNPQGTLDAGPAANLFNGVGTSEPNTIVVKSAYGEDPALEGIVPQGLRTEFDATDWVSRVDFTGEVGFFDTATDVAGEANLSSNPYKDLHGNALKRVGLVQEPDIPAASLNDRASTMLNELSRVKKVLNLDLTQYEVNGDLSAGDFIYAFDPDIGFVDSSADATAESRDLYEVTFRGEVINPVKVRVIGLTFPVIDGMGVYFRDKDGNYTDLSEYVQYENGSAQVELGDVIRTIGDDLRFSEYSLSRETAGAFSIPDLPATPTLQAGTYLNATGDSAGFLRAVVAKPTNIDGSQITDGSHYRIRYKKITDTQYSYANFPYTGVSSESLLIQDLTVGSTYDVGVAVVDKSGFKKMSAYDGTGEDLYTNSSSVNANFATNARVEIEKDGQAPSKPKAATIAAGPLRVQVTHYLGKDGTDGGGNPYGNFTLEGDVDHLDVYAVTQSGNSASFTVATSNKIGEVRVTSGNLLQQIPVIATIELEDSEDYYFRIVAVDKSGNSSDPSDGQTATANLIAEANIADATITTAKIGDAQITTAKIGDAQITTAKVNDLSADKLTSGTITGGEITVGGVSNTSGFIKSYNFSSGSAGWAINSDGSAEFANATVRGTLNASDITAGTLDASAITVSNLNADNISTGTLNVNRLPSITTSQINFDAGDIGGAESATILATINSSSEGLSITADRLDLSGTLSVGDALDVGGSDTSSFHVDVSGNMWLGAGTYAAAPFKVSNAGALAASSFSLTGGSATNLALELGTDSGSGAPTAASSTVLKIGTSTLFERSNKLFSSKPFVVFPDGDEDNPSLTISGDYDEMGFFVSNSTDAGGYSTFSASNGDDDVFSFNTLSDQFNVKGDLQVAGNSSLNGNALSVNGDSGNSSQYIGKDSGGTLGYHDLPATTGSYTTNTNQLTVNNSNSVINISVGNNSNQLSAGHNHPYGTGNGDGNGNSNLSIGNSSNDAAPGSHPNSGHHSHGNQTVLTTAGADNLYASAHNHPYSSSNHGNNAHNVDYAVESYVNGQILDHRFSVSHSDERLKEDIAPITLGLDFLNRLTPRDFNWKSSHLDTLYAEDESMDLKYKGMASNLQQGFVAQEVKQAVFDETGSNTAFSGLKIGDITEYDSTITGDSDNMGRIELENFIPPLVKAVQQLSAKIDVLEARIDELEGE